MQPMTARARPAETPRSMDLSLDESDQALVARVMQGDPLAFDMLHRRHYRRIYRLALARTRHPDDAADIAAETFCKALVHLSRYEFRGGDSLYPWLHKIASNLILDAARKRPAYTEVSLEAPITDEDEPLLESLADPGASPHELAERRAVQALVREAICHLPADQAAAVRYRFLDDLSLAETARALGQSEGAVEWLLKRALASLRRGLLTQWREQRAGWQ